VILEALVLRVAIAHFLHGLRTALHFGTRAHEGEVRRQQPLQRREIAQAEGVAGSLGDGHHFLFLA